MRRRPLFLVSGRKEAERHRRPMADGIYMLAVNVRLDMGVKRLWAIIDGKEKGVSVVCVIRAGGDTFPP